jgi:tRNA(Ile2) C34 agmatinyltransferase TiaS
MSTTTRPTAPRCSCGADGELRRCTGNGGIAWRCPRCLTALTKWIPHESPHLAGVNLFDLPPWDAPAVDDTQIGLRL